ncbi:MAG TPA: hypothetical protein VIQ11_06420 [Mycobacterium sp.]
MSADFWTAVESLATVVAAIVAVITLLGLRADSQERTRPLVTAGLERPPTVGENTGLDLVLRNNGATAARDVRVELGPQPLIIEEDPEKVKDLRKREAAQWLVDYFAQPITTLPAGRRIRANYYWVEDDPADRNKRRNAHPLPDQFTVKISYREQESRGLRRLFRRPAKEYVEEFPLVIRDFDDSFMEWKTSDRLLGIHRAIDNVVRKLDSMG